MTTHHDELTTVLEAAKEARETAVKESQDVADGLFVSVVRRVVREREITVTDACALAGISRTNMYRLFEKFPEGP